MHVTCIYDIMLMFSGPCVDKHNIEHDQTLLAGVVGGVVSMQMQLWPPDITKILK